MGGGNYRRVCFVRIGSDASFPRLGNGVVAMMHDPIRMLPDDFGIGQKAVARIRMETAQGLMAGAAQSAFSTGYVNPTLRAAARGTFYAGRSQYETAKAVWEMHSE